MNSPPIDQLQQQIEVTRRNLDETLHAIRERLSPRVQVKRTLHASGQWAIDNPTAAVLGVAAVAVFIYLETKRRRRLRNQ